MIAYIRPPQRARTVSRTCLALAGLLGASLSACDKKPLAPMVMEPSEAIGQVSVSPSVLIIAIGETRQLSVNAASLAGAPVTNFDRVEFALATRSDSVRVNLTPDGQMTGKAASSAPIRINVLVGWNGGYSGAQALLQVTDAAISGAELSIQPSDSTRLAAGTRKAIVPVLRNSTTGESVSNPTIRYAVRPADADRMRLYEPRVIVGGLVLTTSVQQPALQPNEIMPLAGEGSVWIFGEIDAWGTVLRDSVLMTLSYPYTALIETEESQLNLVNMHAGQILTLAPGATVRFRNGVFRYQQVTMTFTFDDPVAAGAASPPSSVGGSSGNVTTLSVGQMATRRFTTPGTYTWTMTSGGSPAVFAGQTRSGTIVIK